MHLLKRTSSHENTKIQHKSSIRKSANINAFMNKPDYFFETIRNKGFAYVSQNYALRLTIFVGKNDITAEN